MVGSAILRLLQTKGYTSLLLRSHHDLDLSNQEACRQFFRDEQPEYVFLAAARVGGINANNQYPAEFFYQNMMIAANVIDAAYRSGVKKLVNLGSSCIYPKLAPQPLKEETLLSGALEKTNEAYAIAKIAAVKMCAYYNREYGCNYVSLMPTNLYGPNDSYHLENSHVLPALIRKFVLAQYLHEQDVTAVRRNVEHEDLGFGLTRDVTYTDDELVQLLSKSGIKAESVSLWGSGSVYREFLHADDIAEASVYFMNSVDAQSAGEIVNIGTGIDITIRDLAQLIADIVGFKGAIVYDASKPDGTPRKLLDVSRAAALGWKSRISLEEGLRSVVADYTSRLVS